MSFTPEQEAALVAVADAAIAASTAEYERIAAEDRIREAIDERAAALAKLEATHAAERAAVVAPFDAIIESK